MPRCVENDGKLRCSSSLFFLPFFFCFCFCFALVLFLRSPSYLIISFSFFHSPQKRGRYSIQLLLMWCDYNRPIRSRSTVSILHGPDVAEMLDIYQYLLCLPPYFLRLLWLSMRNHESAVPSEMGPTSVRAGPPTAGWLSYLLSWMVPYHILSQPQPRLQCSHVTLPRGISRTSLGRRHS